MSKATGDKRFVRISSLSRVPQASRHDVMNSLRYSLCELLQNPDFAVAPSHACFRSLYLFTARSAAVLGSSNVSTPDTRELYQISLALKPAAPEDGRTPLNTYRPRARFPRGIARRHFKARDQHDVHDD
jgi:hypothetical protein